LRVAIVGGGPGGLFAARYLEEKAGTTCEIRLFEAGDRLGGKIITKDFAGIGRYEAGVAEIYDYSGLGPDPLRDLIEKELHLRTMPIDGQACVLDGQLIDKIENLAEHFGPATYEAAAQFRCKCARLLRPREFYKSVRDLDNVHPWAMLSGEEILAGEIKDDMARRYIRVMSHSDVAAPPHQTSGLTLLKNVLMDVDGYMGIYSVIGGNEQIVEGIAAELDAEIRLNTPIRAVLPLEDGRVRLSGGCGGAIETFDADFVIFALPITALSIIDWRHPVLHKAMFNHIRHFDRPAHYLRVTLLFERAFWREHLDGHWWMLDSFDGCVVYDESSRQDLGKYGALGFLIAGNAALGMANFADERIEEMCLDALPLQFGGARSLLLDRRIHRWMASVSAVPGGVPVRERLRNHRPTDQFPRILIVGDYLFDSTLNGVLDSAETASDLVIADIVDERRPLLGKLGGSLQINGHCPGISQHLRDQFFSAAFLADMLHHVWGLKPGAKVLNFGSSAGVTVAALREAGFDAYGVEASALAHARTVVEHRKFNLHTDDPAKIPFADGFFDVVIETGLCYVARSKIATVIGELRRVSRGGVMLGSTVTDLTMEMIDRHNLQLEVETLRSRWYWAEEFYAQGFDHSLSDPDRLEIVWKHATAFGAGPGHWYEEPEALLYAFYDVDHSTQRAQQQMPKTQGTAREIVSTG
jgi:monoamine oxidase